MIIKRMWNNGPLQEWSERREKRTQIPWATGGFAGQYVCDEGNHQTIGLYCVIVAGQDGQRWLCGTHKEQFRPKQAQPKSLQKGHERRPSQWVSGPRRRFAD